MRAPTADILGQAVDLPPQFRLNLHLDSGFCRADDVYTISLALSRFKGPFGALKISIKGAEKTIPMV